MSNKPPLDSREKTKSLLIKLQEKICNKLEKIDSKGKFIEESWLRPEGGGGKSRVLKMEKFLSRQG